MGILGIKMLHKNDKLINTRYFLKEYREYYYINFHHKNMNQATV